MKRLRRILPLLLALTLLASALSITASAYAPLTWEYDGRLRIDLSAFTVDELEDFSVSKFLTLLKEQNGDAFDDTDITKVGYTKGPHYDSYEIVDAETGRLDLADRCFTYSKFVIVVGDGRQLGAGNRRYDITTYFGFKKMTFLYQTDEDATWKAAKTVFIDHQIGRSNWDESTYYSSSVKCYFGGDHPASLRMQFQTGRELENLRVYEGTRYDSAAETEARGKLVDAGYVGNTGVLTGELHTDRDGDEYFGFNYSMLYTLGGSEQFQKIRITVRAAKSAGIDGTLNAGTLRTADGKWVDWYSSNTDGDGYSSTTFYLDPAYPVDAVYYLNMLYYSVPSDTSGWIAPDKVKHAYIDGDTSRDIKDELFSEQGYPENYSGDGHTFTVEDVYGNTYVLKVNAVNEAYPSGVSFNIEGVANGDTVVPAGAYSDSLYGNYGNSYLSYLLMPEAPLDMSALKPVFDVYYSGSTAYAKSVGASAAVAQTSGVSVVDFTNPPVQYTVRSADGSEVENYWVSFAQKQDEPTLFVHGPSFDTPQNADELAETDKREILLSDTNDYHNIFIANLGDAPLGGLRVSLDADAQKTLALDDYWTVTPEDTLSAFETLDEDAAFNVAQLQLYLKDDPANLETNEISGCLTIESDGGTRYVYLTGTINPSLITDEVPDAVKYVPYSVMVQTNNHTYSNTVTYSITDGELPAGISLNPHTGEIYGVPTQVGIYDFEITASFSAGVFKDSTQNYQIVVSDNTDANVEAENDYTIIERVEDIHETDDYTDQLFHIDHAFSEFEKFFLDGRLLTNGVDYDAEEGSTKITVRAQTFRTAGPGRHTISAEFRNSENVMTKAAQNYTSNVPTSSGSSSSGKANKATKPAETPDNGPFVDVRPSDWFYSNVMWAYEQGHMTGVSSSRFAPDQNTTQAMVVVVLARVAGVDLTKYADKSENLWYTAAANWAAEEGLIASEMFVPNAPIERGALAVMLLKFFDRQKITYTTPTAAEKVAFLDAGEMTAEEENSFQCLRRAGIFYGNGKNDMRPASATTRAHLAALLQRITTYMDAHKA